MKGKYTAYHTIKNKAVVWGNMFVYNHTNTSDAKNLLKSVSCHAYVYKYFESVIFIQCPHSYAECSRFLSDHRSVTGSKTVTSFFGLCTHYRPKSPTKVFTALRADILYQ